MSLIARYIFREALVSTILVMLVLLVIFMSNLFAETLGDAAADELPRDAVFIVLSLQFLRYLALLAPVAILLGILLALARLNRDSEMAALAACGVGPARLLRPIGLLALLVAAAVGWLALVKAPEASRAIEEIRLRAEQRTELGAFQPERCTAIDGGTTMICASTVEGNRLGDVIFASEDEDGILFARAETGETIIDEASGDIELILNSGRQYEGQPGSAEFLIAEFATQGMPIELEREPLVETVESRATSSLLATRDPEARAELQWRLAAPLSIVILSLLAIPLGRSSPREGKYARVGLGLLIYLIYANLLAIARVWVEREAVPEPIGTWWVHGLLALVVLLMLARQSGAFIRAARS